MECSKSNKNDTDEEFYELIKKNKDVLYRIAYCYFKNKTDSLEAIQEITFRAYKNNGQLLHK